MPHGSHCSYVDTQQEYDLYGSKVVSNWYCRHGMRQCCRIAHRMFRVEKRSQRHTHRLVYRRGYPEASIGYKIAEVAVGTIGKTTHERSRDLIVQVGATPGMAPILTYTRLGSRRPKASEVGCPKSAFRGLGSFRQITYGVQDIKHSILRRLRPLVEAEAAGQENCVSFLDPLIESWDIDLETFGMEIVLNRRVAPGAPKKFEFVEKAPETVNEEPGLKDFLHDASLSGDATEKEIEFLRKLRFSAKRPTSLYYYRELQNLRDPLHFRAAQAE